ncbi:uncharacterized protein VP01_10854g1, partial [Puccinia sorghi]
RAVACAKFHLPIFGLCARSNRASYRADLPQEALGVKDLSLCQSAGLGWWRKRGGDTRQTPGKRKPGNYLHHNGTPINGFGDDGNSDNLNGTPARQRGFGSNLGFSTEKDQLRASLAHAQRTINTLRGALQRKKEDALRVKKSSVISLGDTHDDNDNHPENQLPLKPLLRSSVCSTPRGGSCGCA